MIACWLNLNSGRDIDQVGARRRTRLRAGKLRGLHCRFVCADDCRCGLGGLIGGKPRQRQAKACDDEEVLLMVVMICPPADLCLVAISMRRVYSRSFKSHGKRLPTARS
jgi:hypothetical protein